VAFAAPALAQDGHGDAHAAGEPAPSDTTHAPEAGHPTYVPESYDKHADDHGEAGHTQGHGEAYPDDPSGHDPAHTGGGPVDAHHGEGDAHGDTHGEGAHGDSGHGAGHGAMPHLPNALTFLKAWVPASVVHFFDAYKDPIFSLTMAIVLALVFVSLSKKLDGRKPGRLQMAVEMLLGGLYSLFETIIGPTARRYTPYLGSLFIFILFNNLFGLLPLGHAATSSFANTTFALGGLTFLYVQGIALKENGIGGWLHHLAGSPRTTLDWCLTPLFFPLHLVGELIKPLSLSLRLFGNIFGEETLVATMVLLGAGITYSLTNGFAYAPGLPLQFPFYFLGLLSSTIQALVFTLLSTVYIALWLPHGHGDEAHGH
jgi:F-type H+-transporting ATPase subunit a